MSQTFAPGSRVVVRDEEWLVRSVKPTDTGGLAVQVSGLSELVRNKPAIFLTEIDKLEELRPETTKLVHDPSPRYRRSRLYLESLLRRTPPTDERLYVGHRAAMNPANYQLVPAAQALAQPRPRILIADAVGLGKTLEVGILLSELIRRGRGDRILVVALKSILTQFQEEMWARFTIPLVRLDSEGIRRVQAKIPSNMNPFYYFNRVIISIDTLKKDEKYRRYLEECYWDAIVVDECQHVAVRGNQKGKSQRARLANLLARNCDSLILTSATPHDGKSASFASLMNLLEPTAVANEEEYTRDEIQGLFVRRFKKDVAAEVAGSFPERTIRSHHLQASLAEDRVFELLATLEFKTLDQQSRSGGILFRTTLLKAFLSSPAACRQTVQARLKKLESAESPEANHDREVLSSLSDALEKVPAFSKLQKLFELLESFGYDSKKPQRVVIFSERIETLHMLKREIQQRFGLADEVVGIFYGSLDDVTQQSMVKDFGTEKGKLRLLLGSDAASEGINLHYFCHRLVHFDIPWSLITLEQRNGRIDRFGQEHAPDIRYLITVPQHPDLKGDLRVLDRLVEKENAAHKNLGDVAWLMNLHDADQEESRIAQGICQHEPAESIIPDEPTEEVDFLSLLLMEEQDDDAICPVDPPSLYTNDLAYARDGFDEMGQEVEWHDDLDGFILEKVPSDLKLRYNYLPPELSRRKTEFKLTIDRNRVQDALAKSRQDEGRWPEWDLFWNQHPVAEWLNDRVLALFTRHEAPVLKTGAAAPIYLFQGIVSNRRSQPILVKWFGVSGEQILPFSEILRDLERATTNPGQQFQDAPLYEGLPSAIASARQSLEDERVARGRDLADRMRPEQARVREWFNKKMQEFEHQERQGLRSEAERRRLERERDDVTKRWESRKRWFEEGIRTEPDAFLRLAAVLV